MSRYIDVSDLNIPSDENDYDELVAFADKVAEMITDAPSIDAVSVVHGEWKLEKLDTYKLYKVTCSHCGWYGHENYDSYVDISDFAYCPNCGAKMDGECKGE